MILDLYGSYKDHEPWINVPIRWNNNDDHNQHLCNSATTANTVAAAAHIAAVKEHINMRELTPSLASLDHVQVAPVAHHFQDQDRATIQVPMVQCKPGYIIEFVSVWWRGIIRNPWAHNRFRTDCGTESAQSSTSPPGWKNSNVIRYNSINTTQR